VMGGGKKRRERIHGYCETNKDNSLRLHLHSPALTFHVSKSTVVHIVAEQGWPIARVVFDPRMGGRGINTRPDLSRHLEDTSRM
jgi:hypothetical protein